MVNIFYYLWHQRRNVLRLVIGDFTQNYLSSYLGFIWAFLGPLVTLSVLAIVFQVGFRVPPIDVSGVPFVVWLACGMVPWLYIADGLTVGASSITSYSFLVRKVGRFRLAILPIIRLAASGIIHCVLVLFLLILLFYYNINPSLYWLQFPVYLFFLYLLLLGVALFTSAISVFIPDILNLLSIIINLGFWGTPILWHASMLPSSWHWIFLANPAYYIVQGYRDTFVEQQWIWERPLEEHIAFGLWLAILFLIGIYTFKRLRPYFADVL